MRATKPRKRQATPTRAQREAEWALDVFTQLRKHVEEDIETYRGLVASNRMAHEDHADQIKYLIQELRVQASRIDMLHQHSAELLSAIKDKGER